MTSIDPDLQTSLIEHVAHLTAKDYAKVPSDLVKLGFVPKGGEAAMATSNPSPNPSPYSNPNPNPSPNPHPTPSQAAMATSGIADFLTYTYSTWTSGGGAATFSNPKP